MLEAGEDPLYIARRVTRFASEDIGLANIAMAQAKLYKLTRNGSVAYQRKKNRTSCIVGVITQVSSVRQQQKNLKNG